MGVAALPNILSSLRLLFVPVLLILAWNKWPGPFVCCLIGTLLTDSADGFLARRFNATSDFGAKLDSWADFATYLALPFCAWWLRRDAIEAEAAYLLVAFSFYLAAVAAGFLKYRRLTSYHTWSSKALSVLAGVVVLTLFLGGPGWPLRIVSPIAALSCLEEIVITLTLPEWRANVPTLWHARRIKGQMSAAKSAEKLV